jgi:excisionase family DNA binding protein
MKQPKLKTYFTIEETAATLRVSERTVRRWISRGTLAARKVARTVRIPRGSVGEAAVLPEAGRGRPRKGTSRAFSALSDDALAQTWDNPEDAVYDRWRTIYGVRKR